MDKTKIFVGADPELFVINKDGKFISSIGKFGGTKLKPAPLGEDCYVQEDNVAVEFNIPPANTIDSFLTSIKFSLDAIAKRALIQGLELSCVPAAHFDAEELKHPRARVFGCDPDWNAWTKRKNPSPVCRDVSLRSAGGHVHVGCIEWLNDHPGLRPADIIRSMDLHLGIPSVRLDRDQTRRQLYGKAGAFRPKNYGVEYRTLSNFWIQSKDLAKWVFEKTHDALEFLDVGNKLEDSDGVDIQQCINSGNLELMDRIMEKYGLEAARV